MQPPMVTSMSSSVKPVPVTVMTWFGGERGDQVLGAAAVIVNRVLVPAFAGVTPRARPPTTAVVASRATLRPR